MKPKSRRNPRGCLICLTLCNNEDSLESIRLQIPGAVTSTHLRDDLEKFFILRHLLDIPAEWCEQTFNRCRRGGTEEDNPGDDFNIDTRDPSTELKFWFQICRDCMKDYVWDAWKTYQKLIEMQSNLNLMKEKVKNKMKESIINAERMNLYSKSSTRNSIADNIRTLIFPDLTLQDFGMYTEKEETFATREFYLEGDDDDSRDDALKKSFDLDPLYLPIDNNIDNESDEDEDNLLMDEEMFKLPSTVSMPPRKRGRPRNSDRAKHVQYYEYCKRRRKMKASFHWKKCTHCSAKYKREEDLQKHLKMHIKRDTTGKGDFDCDICNFPAKDYFELYTHRKNKHEKEPQITHSCTECEFKARAWKELKEHMRDAHPDYNMEELEASRRLLCTLCAEFFDDKRLLHRHIKFHHPEVTGVEQEVVECEECHVKFPNKPTLLSHIHHTHLRNDKYVCDICGKGFLFMSKLERHKESHQTDKTFICEICGCDYTTKEVLAHHYKRVHKVQKPSSKLKNKETDTNQKEPEEFHKCKYCDFTAPYRVIIKRHLEIHKAEMGHKCNECGKNYTSENGLRRHIRINHSTTKVPCPHCSKIFCSVDYMQDHVAKYCRIKDLPPQNEAVTTNMEGQNDTTTLVPVLPTTNDNNDSSSSSCVISFDTKPHFENALFVQI